MFSRSFGLPAALIVAILLGLFGPARAEVGYTYLEGSDPGGPTFAWEDLSAESPLPLFSLSDELPIGFDFVFYGKTISTLRLTSFGTVILDNRSQSALECSEFGYEVLECFIESLLAGEERGSFSGNCDLRDKSLISAGGVINYHPSNNGEVRVATVGTPGSRRFIAEFLVTGASRPTPSADAQIILHEGTNEITIQYLNVQADAAQPFFTGLREGQASHNILARDCSPMNVADTMVFRFSPAEPPTFFSAKDRLYQNQVAPQPMEPLTIIQTPGKARITAADDLRISFPPNNELKWAVGDTSFAFGGTAAAKVSPSISFADAGETLVVDVTADFADGELLTIDGGSVQFEAGGNLKPLSLFLDGGRWGRTDRNYSLVTGPVPYFFVDNDSGGPGPAFDWVDMSDAQTIAAPQTSEQFPVSIGFEFPYFGNPETELLLQGTGILDFQDQSGGKSRGSNSCLCSGFCGSLIVASRDNVVQDTQTLVLYKTFGAEGDRRFAAEFRNIVASEFDEVGNYLGELRSHDAQIILEEATGKIRIQFDNVERAPQNRMAIGVADNISSRSLDYLVCGAPAIESGRAIEFVPIPVPRMDSAAEQVFFAEAPPTPIQPIVIAENPSTTTIRAGAFLRISIPAEVDANWDVADTSADLTGSAAGKVLATATFEGGKTLALEVLEDFLPGETVTVAGLAMRDFDLPNFSTFRQGKLSLDWGGAVPSIDSQFIRVELPPIMPILSSGAPQTFFRAEGTQTLRPLTVTSSSPVSLLTAGSTLEFTIPNSFFSLATFDPGVTTLALSGPAAGKVSATPAYINFNTTVAVSITSDFAPGESLSIDNLQFSNPTEEAHEDFILLQHNHGSTLDVFPKLIGRRGEYGAGTPNGIGGCGQPLSVTIDVAGALPTTAARLNVYSTTENDDDLTVTLNGTPLGVLARGNSSFGTTTFPIPDLGLVLAGPNNVVTVTPGLPESCFALYGASIVVDAGPAGYPTVTSINPPAVIPLGKDFQASNFAFFPFFRQGPQLEMTFVSPSGRFLSTDTRNIGGSFNVDSQVMSVSTGAIAFEEGTYKLRSVLKPRFGLPYADHILEVPLNVTDGPYFNFFTAFWSPSFIENDGFTSTKIFARPGDSTNDVVSVTANMSGLGGDATTPLFDDGTNGDFAAGDGTWTLPTFTTEATEGNYLIQVRATDAEGQFDNITTQLLILLSQTPRVRFARFVPAVVSNDGTYPTLLEANVTDRDGQQDIVSVLSDLSEIGGPSALALNDAGLNGDVVAGDKIFSFGPITTTAVPDDYSIAVTALDTTSRQHTGFAPLEVIINGAPTSNAGPDQTVPEGSIATLDGTGSSDPDNETLSFQWEQVAGRTMILATPTEATTKFPVPDVLANEVYRFRLKVTDQLSLISTDEVEITVSANDDAPVFTAAAAANPLTLFDGQTANLTATATPPDLNDTVSIVWSIASGAGTLTDNSGPTGAFLAPAAIPEDSTTVVRATATDAGGQQAVNEVSISLRRLPDLELVDASVPTEWRIGQLTDIPLQVRNNGPGDTASNWSDCVLLSTDDQIGGDSPVACFARPVGLNIGQSYDRIVTITVPAVAEGTYFVVVRADGTNTVLETGEANNARIFGPINLLASPCPDLVAENIVPAPGDARAGGILSVDFQVRNIGDAASNATSWQDAVYLSPDTNPTGGGKIRLGALVNPSALAVGQAYSRSAGLAIPQNTTGSYFVMIKPDDSGAMPECDELNNAAFSALPVQVLPFTAPTLTPVDIVVTPDDPFRGEEVTVRWKIRNNGFLDTGPVRFFHLLSIQRDGSQRVYTLANGVAETTLNLAPGQTSQEFSGTATIPFTVWFESQIHVQAVKQEGGTVTTPRASAPILVQTGVPADLIVSSVQADESAFSGQPFTLRWAVVNDSIDPTGTEQWNDAVVLSRDDDMATTADNILLGFHTHFGALNPGDSYLVERELVAPVDASGEYSLIVTTDVSDEVFEGPFEDNNFRDSNRIAISFRPPDLIVEIVALQPVGQLGFPQPLLSGTPMHLVYRVRNIGTGRANGSVTNRHSLSSKDGGSVNLPAIGASYDLAPGTSQVHELFFTVPFDFEAQDAFVAVTTDADGHMFEGENDGNNFERTGSFVVVFNRPNLAADSPVVKQGTIPGELLDFKWTTRNNAGPAGTIAWQERVYLSPDEDFDAGVDSLATIVARNATMGFNATQSSDLKNIPVPAGLTGEYAVFLQLDAGGAVDELLENDNVLRMGTARVGDFCHSDLARPVVNAPESAVTGQQMFLEWTVQNTGTASTSVDRWTDFVYLSRDQFFDPIGDVKLGFKQRIGALNAGESYTASLNPIIPAGLTGAYYVFVFTDGDDDLCERSNDNNTGQDFAATQVLLLPPTDLVVESIDTPTTTTIGQNLTYRWTVRNTVAPTHGHWTDSVYLSADGAWDLSDILIGQVGRNISESSPLAVGASYSGEITAPLPGTTPGEYRILVRADARNVVRETDDANNDAVSAAFAVEATQLELGVVHDDLLALRGEKFYSVDIEATGQTLAIDLKTSNTLSINEVYVAYERMPTRSDFDFRDQDPLQANQIVVVPSTQVGRYFIRVRNEARIGGGDGMQIVAALRPFGVDGVSPQEGGNVGEVTVTVDGARFNLYTELVLTPAGSDDLDAGIRPAFLDLATTSAVATFDLAGAAPGLYDLWAVSIGDQFDVDLDVDPIAFGTVERLFGVDVLPAAFRVVEGGGASVSARLFSQAAVQSGAVYPVTVDVRNNGNTDAPMPILEFSSRNNTPVASERSELAFGSFQMAVLGPGVRRDRLAPGESVQFSVFGQAGFGPNSVAVRHVKTEDVPIDWNALEPFYRDERIDPDWDAAWDGFTALYPGLPEFHAFLRSLVAETAEQDAAAVEVAEAIRSILAESSLVRWDSPSELPPRGPAPRLKLPDGAACFCVPVIQHLMVANVIVPFITNLSGAIAAVDGLEAGLALLHFVDPINRGEPIRYDAESELATDARGKPEVQAWLRDVMREVEIQARVRQAGLNRECGETWTVPLSTLIDPSLQRRALDLNGSSGPCTRILGKVGPDDTFLSGAVEFTKKCSPNGCAKNLRAKFFFQLRLEDTYDFCPGSGLNEINELADAPFLVTNTVIFILKSIESCGLGEEYKSIVDTPIPFGAEAPLFRLIDPDESGASNNNPDNCSKSNSGGPGSCGPGRADCDPDDEVNPATFTSSDPNEIQGPAGFGPENFIAASSRLDYRILFENQTSATAPAQLVRVENDLDPSLDLRRFQLGEMSFGNVVIPVPANRTFYSTVLDFAESRGFNLRVTGSVSISTRKAIWTFETLDPATGEAPTNPLVGFLPPNNTPPEGDGYVTYSIKAGATVPSGTAVENDALIFFDLNEPIETNVHRFTVDSGVPSSCGIL